MSAPKRRRDRFTESIGLSRNVPPVTTRNSGIETTVATALGQSTSPSSGNDTGDVAIAATVCQSATSLPYLNLCSARDLWFEALQRLSEVDQRAIKTIRTSQSARQPAPDGMNELLGYAKKLQRDCDERKYRLTFGGKEFILRDIAGKIIFWLNRFKEVGDVAVNFNPAHAALPWVGIRFLLQAAIGEYEQAADLMVSIEKLTYLTNRCAIYERLYGLKTVSTDILHGLQDALINLYAEMLRLIVLLHRILAKGTAARAAHALVNPGEISGILKNCKDLEVQVEFQAQNCERIRSQEADTAIEKLLQILRKQILRTDENVSSLLERINNRDRIEILDWVSKTLYGLKHETVKEQRTKDTCEWLLRHSRYQEWQDSSSPTILWLCGNAGTGKTFLTSKVIDEIQEALEMNPNHEGLAFFYYNRNESERQDPLTLLRSFVRQLSTIISDENTMQRRLKQYYYQKRRNGSEPTISDCKALLLDFINIYPRTTLILDALDECEKHKRTEIVEVFDYLLSNTSKPLKIFISSRPDGDIKERLKDRANIEIRATDNEDDISRYVRNEIVKHRRWNRSPGISLPLQQKIIQTLQERSQGMFQWTFLQVKQLLVLQREEEILERLGKLPPDLKHTYDEIYTSMSGNEKKIADRAIKWVMCSHVPLTTNEILPAVCQDENSDTLKPWDDMDEELLLEYCHNLLVIDDIRKVWVPSHLSVIEYFEDQWDGRETNSLVSSVCLLLLHNHTLYNQRHVVKVGYNLYHVGPEAEAGETEIWNDRHNVISQSPLGQSNEKYSLLHHAGFRKLVGYATHYWINQCKGIRRIGGQDRVSILFKRFLGSPSESSQAYRNWYQLLRKRQPTSFEMTASFFSQSFFEPEDLVPPSIASFAVFVVGYNATLLDWQDKSWARSSIKNANGRSLLQLAVLSGSVNNCQYLISSGANVNEQIQEICYGNALAAAAARGKKELVELIINSGADVNMRLRYGWYGSALAAAAGKGLLENVELLVKCSAKVDMQLRHGIYGSALAAAAGRGSDNIVENLVSLGANVNMQIQYGNFGSALVAAGTWWKFQTLVLLSNLGADVNLPIQYGNCGSALAAAAWIGRSETVQCLLDLGADPNMALQYGEFGSALAAAAAASRFCTGMTVSKTINILISSGALVNMRLIYGKYRSALSAAKENGFEDRARQLITHSRMEETSHAIELEPDDVFDSGSRE